jgi:hypothetical protein
MYVTLGFLQRVDENSAVLCYYAVNKENYFPTFRGNSLYLLLGPDMDQKTIEDGTDRSYRNAGNILLIRDKLS